MTRSTLPLTTHPLIPAPQEPVLSLYARQVVKALGFEDPDEAAAFAYHHRHVLDGVEHTGQPWADTAGHFAKDAEEWEQYGDCRHAFPPAASEPSSPVQPAGRVIRIAALDPAASAGSRWFVAAADDGTLRHDTDRCDYVELARSLEATLDGLCDDPEQCMVSTSDVTAFIGDGFGVKDEITTVRLAAALTEAGWAVEVSDWDSIIAAQPWRSL
jgi:hypothetical protein